MSVKWNEVEKILSENLNELDSFTKENLIQKISLYKEELLCQNEELKKTKDAYEKLFNNSPLPYIILDNDFKIIKRNIEFTFFFDSSITHVSNLIYKDDLDLYFGFKKNLLTNKHTKVHLRMYVRGKILYILLFGTKYKLEKTNYLFALIDETKETNYLNQIKNLSYYDQLTGLYNRRFFEVELTRLDNSHNMPFSIICIDVNGLKIVNDNLGHSFGDKLLIEVAKKLKESSRDSDIISRIGGDEFTILLPKTDSFLCAKIVDRLNNTFSKILIENIVVSTALGYATKTSVDENINEILNIADKSMYESKLNNKDSHRVDLINSILATLKQKHKLEEQHSNRVAILMADFAKTLKLNITDIELYKIAGMMHDIGKIAIEYSILEAQRALSLDECKEIKRHPELGYNILMSTQSLRCIADIVYCHHERFDGNGYPRGITGRHLPKAAMALTICDSYDAMVSDRPYRKGLVAEEAKSELLKYRGSQFSPELVDIFIEKVI